MSEEFELEDDVCSLPTVILDALTNEADWFYDILRAPRGELGLSYF